MDLYNTSSLNIPGCDKCRSDMCRLKTTLRYYTNGESLRQALDRLLRAYEGLDQYWISETIYIASMFKYSDNKAICLEYLREKQTDHTLMELALFYYFMQQAKLVDGFETHPKGLEQAYIDIVGTERAKSFKTKYRKAVTSQNYPHLKPKVKEMLLPYPDAYLLASKHM